MKVGEMMKLDYVKIETPVGDFECDTSEPVDDLDFEVVDLAKMLVHLSQQEDEQEIAKVFKQIALQCFTRSMSFAHNYDLQFVDVFKKLLLILSDGEMCNSEKQGELKQLLDEVDAMKIDEAE